MCDVLNLIIKIVVVIFGLWVLWKIFNYLFYRQEISLNSLGFSNTNPMTTTSSTFF